MTTSSLLLALGILSSSFFGSWHCAGMCGPIATLIAQRKSLWNYHLGRFISYVTLGVLAGSLGQFFLNSEFVWLRWISAALMAAALLYTGLSLIFPNALYPANKPDSFRSKLWNLTKRIQSFHLGRSGFMVGLLTIFLPCGWLYTYVMAAVATRSPWAGGLTLLLFWLGGLPALIALPMMIRQTIQAAGLRHQRIAGVVLLVSGLYSVASFMFFH